MKNIIATGLACCMPIGLAAGDSNPPEANLGTMAVLVVDDSAPGGADLQRAVLTARTQEVSVLHERGRWM
ncbi:MAG TPA: hypothetical protein VF348_04275 [Usitatibacter sp.]